MSFLKYESDCLVAALNGEDVGNINHSWKFAEDVVREISVTIQIDLKTHFKTPLACTGCLPPVGRAFYPGFYSYLYYSSYSYSYHSSYSYFYYSYKCLLLPGMATDKMTTKRHTNHLAAFLTPDVNAPLSDTFLKPVFIGMPIVYKHGGLEIAEQMIKIAEAYLVNLGEQLQALNNDGQYVGLNIKKHFFEIRKDLQKRKSFLIYNWDPFHRNNLADKDARKEEREESSYFNESLDTVQWVLKNIGYGNHFEEYLAVCEELGIDPRAPTIFSDTRFPQFSYNTLRNFLECFIRGKL